MKTDHAADMINTMPDSEKQQFLNAVISKLKDVYPSVRGYAAGFLGALDDAGAVEALGELEVGVEYVHSSAYRGS